MEPNNIILRITSYLCHQQPSRCFFIGEQMLPLCARCTGIYTGFLIAFLFLWITALKKKFLHFSKKVSVISSIFLFILLIEGFLSSKEILTAGNNIRFLLGLLGGSSVGIFSFGLINYSFRGKTYFAKTVFSSKDLLILIGILLFLYLFKISIHFSFLFYLWNFLILSGLFFTYITVNLTFVSVFWKGKRATKTFRWKLGIYTAILLFIEILLIVFLKR